MGPLASLASGWGRKNGLSSPFVSFIHAVVHSLIQPLFIECLLGSRHRDDSQLYP